MCITGLSELPLLELWFRITWTYGIVGRKWQLVEPVEDESENSAVMKSYELLLISKASPSATSTGTWCLEETEDL